MMYLIGFTLALLTITAGLFLLAKTKDGLGKFYKVMAWIIIGCGILIVLGSVQLGAFKFISGRFKNCPVNPQNQQVNQDQKDPCTQKCFKAGDGDKKDIWDKLKGDVKIRICTKDKEGEEIEDVDEVMIFIKDSLKLPVQQQDKLKKFLEKEFD